MLKESQTRISQSEDLISQQILAELLNPEDSQLLIFQQWLSGLSISPGEVIPQLFLLPLGITLLDPRLQNKDRLPSATWSLLEGKLLNLCAARDWQESGLPFLLGATESFLPRASYWSASDHQALIDPSFIALVAQAFDTLIQHPSGYDGCIDELLNYGELINYSTNELLWSESYGLYLPLDIVEQKQVENESIGGLMCLLAPLPDQEQAESMYRCLALNFVHPDHYYFPLECLSDSNGEGQIDTLANYLLFQGLLRYEFNATAEALRRQQLEEELLPGARSSLRMKIKPRQRPPVWAQAIKQAFQHFPEVHPSNLE